MNPITRRDFIRMTGVGLGAFYGIPLVAQTPGNIPEPYITCFYQFNKQSLDILSGKDGLPNGKKYLHIFSESRPGNNSHPNTANLVHSYGSSFKYALAFDLHKYTGWATVPDDKLQAWAYDFRQKALDSRGPADYFAFNEMPSKGAMTLSWQSQIAKLVRYLNEAGGGPKLRGIFYFTEGNLNPQHWQGDSDDFWAALNETCDLVVGEHYHSYDFIFSNNVTTLANHYFALPQGLYKSGKKAQMDIAEKKYAVLHSSYYGPNITGWAGVQNSKQALSDLEKYFEYVVKATRSSELGKSRISFGPLLAKELDMRVHPVLARVLGRDARQY